MLLLALAPTPVLAQCASWDTSFGVPGVTGGELSYFAIHDDGSGPALHAGGVFSFIDGVGVPGDYTSVARWNGDHWSALGAPSVFSLGLESLDTGGGASLYVFGNLTIQNPYSSHAGVWRYNGTGWVQVGVGPSNESVTAMVVYDDGSGPMLYRAVGTNSWTWVQRYQAPNWVNVVSVVGTVLALAVYDDGIGSRPALYIGGNFTIAWDVTTRGLARWNGTNVTSTGGLDGQVEVLRVLDGGGGPALYAGGQFLSAGGVASANVARLHGASWEGLAGGVNGRVTSLAALDDGDGRAIYVAGRFQSAGGVPAANVARFRNGSWSALGAGLLVGSDSSHRVRALAAHDDGADGDADLYAGGSFTAAGGVPSIRLARWNGCATASFCSGDGSVAACPCGNGGAPGRGCENSTSSGGALLEASGSSHPDRLVLTSGGEVGGALSIFLQGDAQIAAAPFGDGLLCVGGNRKRLYTSAASAIGGEASAPQPGDPSISARSAALGDPIAMGSARVYQVQYRDRSLAFCPSPQGSTFNASNALRIVW